MYASRTTKSTAVNVVGGDAIAIDDEQTATAPGNINRVGQRDFSDDLKRIGS